MNDPELIMDKAHLDEALRVGQEGADALVRLQLATSLSREVARDVAAVLRLVIDSALQALAGAEQVVAVVDRLANGDGR